MPAELIAVLAIYGAVVATFGLILGGVLAYREIRRERRRIKVTLEWVTHYEFARVLGTNVGFRPITISVLGMEIWDQSIWDRVPENALLSNDPSPLPVTLEDGEQVALDIQQHVSLMILNSNWRVRLDVYDAEGNRYTEFDTRVHDARWGHVSERPKTES